MKRVDIDDGRSSTGDYASTFAYDGLAYDRTHRASLGFDTVTITELDVANGDAPLRINEQLYLNDSVFVKGLMTKATMLEPDVDPTDGTDPPLEIRGSTVTWGFNVVRATQADPRRLRRPGACRPDRRRSARRRRPQRGLPRLVDRRR